MSLAWFLIRVIPKPIRATYPCQRAALPLATAFIVWATGMGTSAYLYVRGKMTWRRRRYALAVTWFVLTGVVVLLTWSVRNQTVMATVGNLRNELKGASVPQRTDRLVGDQLAVDPAAVVGAAKSTEAQAADVTAAEISAMVNEAIALAGGLDEVVADGDTVILKPNVISWRDDTSNPQQLAQEVNGITTDYRVIQAVVDAVRAINPSGAVFLMEGSGVGSTSTNFGILGYDQITGLDDLIYLEQACGAWFDTSSVYLQGITLPEEQTLYDGANGRYFLNKLYYEADVLISLPVLKNHFVTGVTGAVKNVGIGATPPTIYGVGPPDPNPHVRALRIDHGDSFGLRLNLHNWIHDFYLCRPVDFVIMDGLQGIENGPLCYMSQYLAQDQMNARLILASRDPIAMDACASLLCGQDPGLIAHLITLHNDQMGCNDPRLIRVNGITVGDEKQPYQIHNSGTFSRYFDFTSPSFSVDSCYVSGDRLCFELTADPDVVKVEVMVDGTFLRQIQVEGFDAFCLDLDGVVVNVQSEIIVFGYDRYLNHHREPAQIAVTAVAPGAAPKLEAGLRVAPTPVRGFATVWYVLPEAGDVSLAVYSVLGREVEILDRGRRPAGEHQVIWNSGGMKTGVYFLRLQAGDEITTHKLTIVR
jgi:uncharacterized protein (DUF362 family)